MRGSGVSGLSGEKQVEQDERVRVPMADEANAVQDDPHGNDGRLDHEEAGGAEVARQWPRKAGRKPRVIVAAKSDAGPPWGGDILALANSAHP